MELTAWVEVSKPLSAIVATSTLIVALVTLGKTLQEYRRAQSLKRFEKMQEMLKITTEPGSVRTVCDMLYSGSDQIEFLDYRVKEEFLGFYEQLAILNRSKVLNDELLQYMFGYYALKCFKSETFWSNIDKDHPYWRLFIQLCLKLLEIERRQINQKTLKIKA